ncbi:YbgA family protein [Spirochaeta isovalerica]|uniref:Uncharacterized protein YbgA (DUF1722 family)/uncharacterized protein YbbK (DUF523 family) n=1 Tax=Spirochaeta isovalerica TaxID=150 RepID=A0A841RDT8_9SPIO|nr:DUF523 and DUF1722 domain-containing protein [Spirochaeta isovalerica]MBB6481387.1 uncharacterized protein YbgA (DUF1722 family)/uncharacterized protein YbbK (DUF523 family) [Spirochaeta isovalerica]
MKKIKVGVSSCLLGNNVRYNGQHQLDHFIRDTLGQWCEFVPVCPEVECGLPIPRESMRLVGDVNNPRLMTGKTGIDHTEKMKSWIEGKLPELEREELVAFVFKTKSPSSGMRKIKIYNEQGERISFNGIGMFARAFMERFPDIPVEDEGRLCDPGLREQFIETIFVLQRWRDAVKAGTAKAVVDFHTKHKYTFMAHSPQKLKELGKLTARAGTVKPEELVEEYRTVLHKLLKEKKDRKKNYNVILHIMGYFKNHLTAGEKDELLKEAQLYYDGISPVIVPLTLLKHYTMKYEEPYLLEQYYLNPHPVELGLLNHV